MVSALFRPPVNRAVSIWPIKRNCSAQGHYAGCRPAPNSLQNTPANDILPARTYANFDGPPSGLRLYVLRLSPEFRTQRPLTARAPALFKPV
jgi:hypothetical protein